MMAAMKVRDFFLADYADVKDSLAFISGAFPEWWTVVQIPAPATIYVVLLLDYTEEPDELAYFDVEVHGPKSDVHLFSLQAKRGATDRDTPGGPRFQPVALQAHVTFQEVGLHQFILFRRFMAPIGGGSSQGPEEARVSLWVQLAPGHNAFDTAKADDTVSR
jgi:hypothetical protein